MIFRWLHSIAGDAETARQPLLSSFRQILQDSGVTVVDDEETDTHGTGQQPAARLRRRVSFDDAHYEETWLSEHTRTLDGGTPEHNLLRYPPFRGREGLVNGHARAKSVPDGRHFKLSTGQSGSQLPSNGVELPQTRISSAELDEQAEAILDLKTCKLASRCLSLWHSAVVSIQAERASDETRAIRHDFQVLTKQAWDIWHVKATLRRSKKDDEARRLALEERLAGSGFDMRRKALTQWQARLAQALGIKTESRRHMLGFRYFMRWRSVAAENAHKAKFILMRKFFSRWHDLSLERRTDPESVERIRKKRMLRKHLHCIIQARSDVVADRHYSAQMQRHYLYLWFDRLQQSSKRQQGAAQIARSHVVRVGWKGLFRYAEHLEQSNAIAVTFSEKRLLTLTLPTLCKELILLPRLRVFQEDIIAYLKRKVLDTWKDATLLAQKASSWRRAHLLQANLTAWNDALRVRSMSTQISERIKADYLSQLYLAERLRLFRRNADSRLVHSVLLKIRHKQSSLQGLAETQVNKYEQDAARRALVRTFQRLHAVQRHTEDQGEAAVEARNSRLMPKLGSVMKQQIAHVDVLHKSAKDAYFFMSVKRCLKIWSAKTLNAQQEKRRVAFEHMRARIKTRMVRACFFAMRRNASAAQSLQSQAVGFDSERVQIQAGRSLARMRELCVEKRSEHDTATEHDLDKLLRAALLMLAARYGYLVQNVELADALRLEIDRSMLTILLKRLRFAALTSTRLNDSSRLLQERLTQHHHHRILRHLAAVAKGRIVARSNDTDRDPESPSSRPASRAASQPTRKSSARSTATSNLDIPVYLRTPSRARKSLLRQLPTPAPYTPFVFTPGLLTGTPVQAQPLLDDSLIDDETNMTPKVTSFRNKLRAGGISTGGPQARSLYRDVLSRSAGPAGLSTGKSVRFLGGGGSIRISRMASDNNQTTS